MGAHVERRRPECRGAAGAEGVGFGEGVSPSPIGQGSGEGALPPPRLGMVHFSSILTRLGSSQGLLQYG